jgi:adenosylhomocysteine nucleosidase
VLISADTEWRHVRAIFGNPAEQKSPLGEWLVRVQDAQRRPAGSVLHAGWGKVSSGAAAQYAIDRWHPRLLVNLGTCGGFCRRRRA